MKVGLLLRDAEFGGRRADVRVRGEVITEIGRDLRHDGEDILDAHGGALLPGLHDHHIHLNALAAADNSVSLGPPHVTTSGEAATALRRATPISGWVRAVNYHESVAGQLDRHVLDKWVPNAAVRVQHRTGAVWVLNSHALQRIAPLLTPGSPGVELDAQGVPTGRLWRLDDKLVSYLPNRDGSQRSALRSVTARLLAYGLTGVTDATPGLTSAGLAMLAETHPLRLHLLGTSDGIELPHRWTHGPRKILLHDHELPSFDDLLLLIDPLGLGDRRRPIAVHCVTRESLTLTTAALDVAGPRPGDRIEHGSVVPPELDETIRRLGLTVVTQPDFLRTRGDAYLRDVGADDAPHLYRWASLTRSAVAVAPSSDAPYGDPDPWQVMRSARSRCTDGGVVVGPDDRVSVKTAIAGYLTAPDEPGGRARRVRVGAPADLCLLQVPLADAIQNPCHELVAATVAAGKLVFHI